MWLWNHQGQRWKGGDFQTVVDQLGFTDISHRHMRWGFVDSNVSTAGLLLAGKSDDLLQVQHEGQGESS